MTDRETLPMMVERSVSHPDSWIPGDEVDSYNSSKSYPDLDMASGGIKLFEWLHETREESVEVWFNPSEDTPYAIEVITSQSTLHGHGSCSWSGAMEACSVSMYMMNHFAFLSEQDDSEVEALKERIEELEEAADGEQSRRQTLEEKNELLRSQLNTLIETGTTGYDQGNWRGMIQRPQFWRPPTTEEILNLAFFIDKNWHGKDPESREDVTEVTKDFVSDSYIIVLDDIEFKHTQNGDQLLFMHNRPAGEYSTFLLSDEKDMIEIAQRPTMRNREHSSEQTSWFMFND